MVDDDAVARQLARRALEASGFSVSLAENGVQALSVFAQRDPDLVLLDVEMPELDGLGTCRLLREQPNGDIPIIMMTGHDDAKAIAQAFEAKATDFVSKPISWPILIQRVRYIMRATETYMELKRSQQRLLNAQQMANLGYWDWDMSSDHLHWSEQACQILGHSQESLQGFEDYVNIVHEDDREQFKAELNAKVAQGEPWLLDHRIVTEDGSIRFIKSAGETVFSGSRHVATWSMGTMIDVTEQRRSEDTIRRMAFYDEVTGLHNRVAFLEELNLVLNLHKRLDNRLAVLFLDLDDFKRVNDSMGHFMGDRLLKSFADRLVQDLRACDLVAAEGASGLARLGGDEFTLMLPGLVNKTDAAVVARRIQANLMRSFILEEEGDSTILNSGANRHELFIGASIGIAVYPDDGLTADELLKNADTAMYAAKQAGKNTYRYYANRMNERALERLTMETRLRGALEHKELSLHYQPQIDLRSGLIVGVEALLRWRNPELGNVPPIEFIPLAEETGQIIEIGRWVLEEACTQLKQWHNSGLAGLRVAVNLSSLQFHRGNLEEAVAQVLIDTGLDAGCLELELTESVVMRDVERSIVTLHALKSMGVMLSIDDFGTGYSSLSYLQRFPIDTIKIDKSFVNGLGVDANNTAITRAIVAMAHSLGFTVIAEGIEESSQLEFLRRRNCDLAQGYFFSKPVPVKEFDQFIAGQSTGVFDQGKLRIETPLP